MRKLIFSFVITISLVNASLAQCDIIYVAPDSTGSGSTMDDPASIQDAFSRAVEGSVIRLNVGTYDIDSVLTIPA